MTVVNKDITLGRVLRFAAFVCFVAAFCVTQKWVTVGPVAAWVTAGLALYTAPEVI